ncbi:NAD(P)-dependent dehydrogenase, short-chain alcohol dehydrogenase family [Cyclobacterium lianum]|uniref:NAD(P)-dependent dehydrogenase, short-chain alcohol dehydrogenase family n=1 Tax=Cyclobacterium lianum TaxID=388280 RepID=A0A1M7QDX2_9BACT|nr:SDR family oxidoreductase [Cyclobacterium lianum]SHN28694.1 NAD(P)-dependent dehydrogenase, short-chain alcohol dehydrogenase family [Cyclobacterium lianum]
MKEKNIIIIGGNSGIGKKVKELLEEEGANVMAFSKSGSGSGQLDITSDFDTIDGLPEEIHGLVYCPGTINLKPFHRISLSDFQKDLEINYLGAIKVLQALQRPLKKSAEASVVLFSTVAVQTGMGFHSSIAGAKGAVEGLCRSLAAEWANAGIRVNAIAPSLTDTPLAENLLSSPEKKEGAGKRHPLGRYGEAADMAAAVIYLLSDRSSWMTGQVLKIDGGLSSVR